MAITSSALIIPPTFPGELEAILISTYFTLASAMACLVFRSVLLEISRKSTLLSFAYPLARLLKISKRFPQTWHQSQNRYAPRRPLLTLLNQLETVTVRWLTKIYVHWESVRHGVIKRNADTYAAGACRTSKYMPVYMHSTNSTYRYHDIETQSEINGKIIIMNIQGQMHKESIVSKLIHRRALSKKMSKI